ncbi:reverse transcriptase domain-containing protein [Citrus sinensis]|uniref:Reverse transcriptase domain-containing protein n=1 Tax=Citrus sinensis TaxID=2711 RepID=A0ACB8HV64_CITSI|nr:reverse transcriptase domain-containing protein [Citrus sinensis]
MAGSSSRGAIDLHNECARLQLDEEEEGGLEVAVEEDEDNGRIKNESRYCLVGRFLTNKVINFTAMKNTMAALWRPGKGVCIKNLSPTLFLFQFFHEIDVRRVLDSGPWTFDQHILLVHRLGMMNFGERWLRTAPPEMKEGNLGNYLNSGIAMVVVENGVTKSAKDGNKSRGKEQMDRNVPITAEPPTLVRDKVGQSCGLALYWKPNFMVQLLKFGKTFIDVAVGNSEGRQWRVTGFYGFPESVRRRESWRLLRSLALTSFLPWICLGDFNDLLHSSEKRGKNKHLKWKLHGFQKAVSDVGLFNLGMSGYQFTWERSWGSEDWVENRLDRALASNSWIHLFSKAKVISLETSCSDHLSIFLDPVPMERTPRSKKFRFENSWLRESDCFEVVKDRWASSIGVPIQNKIGSCGSALLRWGNHLTQDFRVRILECKRKMALFRGNRDSASVDSFIEARKHYNELLHSHEIFWKQRAKSIWLKEGDMNSRYFHVMASTRKKQNVIGKLRNAQGQWCTTPEDINEIINKYFTHIFSSEGGSCGEVLQYVEPRITVEQNHSLMEPFSPADVREAIFSMHLDKSPGPDGMNPAFFQKIWSIIGDEVSAACLNYIIHCVFLADLKETTVILIPKKPNPDNIIDFQPIALCNVLYKIVAKMLASRLKLILGSIISNSQSAFIPGRAITDNIMISTELMHYFKRKRHGKEGAFAFKIDMAKAYDKIEWGFLSSIMLKIVVAFGKVTLLSPYLFVICIEGLSSLINHYERAGLLHGVRIARGAPYLTHLFFADDCFLFFKASPQEARAMKTVLSLYGAASGQKVNYNKSSISFSANVNNEVAHSICSLLGVQGTDDHGTYLGLPSYIGKSKSAVLSYIRDRVWKRLQG